jgi:hypothetical protein
MAGNYGNENLAFITGCQYLTVDGTSDSITLPEGVHAVDLYSTEDAWVQIGERGVTAPTVAAPGAEKTEIDGFFMAADVWYTGIPVPLGNDAKKVPISAIQGPSATAGTLYVNYRKFS